MIDEKLVKHIAKLARLKLSEKEIQKLEKELSKILDYIEKLKEVNIENVEPTSHPLFLKNIWREDEKEKEKNDVVLKLIKAFPENKNGYLKVKKVI